MNSKSYQRSQRVTMKDVAIESGVSQSTVSFVLNGLETCGSAMKRETR